ncbi:protein bark beetle-like isoform X3 [Mizuhopecten yessoensis]|uniref:protein bark beetle-like isoform X2 n=1 Tax=Mizuhopecten yessoensis TaxID=6573 RepID=UPI000B45ECC8|nr:protein bark beetle-like isoform X2 [Mizuhopecten yessoensis]XP_021367969.1 protein bark beetle-like isoform X3 [Mizuhopecten yessoensis]
MAVSVLFSVLYLTFVCFVDVGWGQRITPPPPGNLPVVSDGIVYNLRHVPAICREPRVLDPDEIKFGIVIKGSKKALMRDQSPYKVYGNIELDSKACLYIEPGTTMHFGAGYGMIINGTLIARGSEGPGGRITMTKDPEGINVVGSSSPFPTTARLMDGNTTRDGKLELFYKGKWRGVCTNYLNYSKIDANVTCKHLGFVGGNFTYHSFSRNRTEYMFYPRPECSGTETDLFNCPGNQRINVGTHICDGQQLIGFECIGLRSDLAMDYWRGLEFYNSTTESIKEEIIIRKEPLSWLEYLDISYAGRDINRNDGMIHGRASISASPDVPLMNNVTITNGAYDGLNMTEITGRIHIANSTVADNRGYGAFIQSNVGRVLINMTDMDNNWGDGVKMYMTNFTIHDWDSDFPADVSFCRSANLLYQTYPVLVHENIIDDYGNKPTWDGRDCEKVYRGYGKRITVHFLLMERAPSVSGFMTIYDGAGSSGNILATFPFNNGSFPQSITSDTDTLTVRLNYTLPTLTKPTDPKKQWCEVFRPCVRFLLEITAAEGPEEEFRFINSSASNNNGYGVNIQDMRSKVSFNSSVVSDNKYGAGIRIYQGAGEIAINNTVVERNLRSGVNITYSGGYQLVNNSKIIDNRGYGIISEYERLNKTRFELLQKIEIVHSHFEFNQWIALRIGNYCRGGRILVNESNFNFNFDEAIEYLSCNVSTMVPTNFSLAFNMFNGNVRHGVLMFPMVNTIGRLTNNTFRNHSLGAVRIDNGYDLLISKWYSDFGVSYEIFENIFKENYGRYAISMRLTQSSPFQKIVFSFNSVVDNYINDTSDFLNPRNRANAPIIVSSGNILVQRNRIFNPHSVRDMATHLVDPSVIIKGDLNWWETISHEYMYGRIFDNDDRYNLAEIEYYPALRDNWLYGPLSTAEYPKYRWVFSRGGRIGGVLDTPGFTTESGIQTYHVDKDIFIRPGVTFTIRPGTTLEFENSIGMVVHGRLKADGGSANTPIVFQLRETLDVIAIENRTASVRLVDGTDEYEGRLEVLLDNAWGTVCNDGWTPLDSSVVCQQLGLTFNPEFGEALNKNAGLISTQKMHMSGVDCDQLDTDLTKCRSLRDDQFSCDPRNIVFLRCQLSTWSGVTIPAVPTGGSQEDTQIRHVIIRNAGLLDYEEMKYTPALRIDYMFYKMTGLQVLNSASDGVVVKYSNPHTENLFEFCKFDNNLGHGFLTRSPYLRMFYTTMSGNFKSGFAYDPFFTEYEALSVRNFIHRDRIISFTQTPMYNLGDSSMIFITTSSGSGEERHTYDMEIAVTFRYRITLQILDYNPLTTIESVTIYDSSQDTIGESTNKWEIEKDLVDFPIVSTSTRLTIRLVVTGVRTDRLTFAAHSHVYSPTFPMSSIYVYNSTMANNYQGIVTKHYNNPSNEKSEIFHRAKEEEIKFVMVQVYRNKMEAMYIPSLTKYHENFLPTLEEMTRPERIGMITYKIERTKFLDNGRGLVGDHNHVDFANNVWHWNITDCEFKNTADGGFDIELPRVNDMLERKFHSIFIQESRFVNNPQFGFSVNGYYANVTMIRNVLSGNVCPRGLVTIGGMEKEITFQHNSLVGNIAKYMFELNTHSHSEYSGAVSGMFSHNQVQGNNPPINSFVSGATNIPQTYSIALRGVQQIKLHRNLIDNPQLQYELVAAISSLSLDTVLDVTENWWGTQFQNAIQKRIFDFDDWNNYALAKYFPQLTVGDINSLPATGSAFKPPLDLERLGGRVHADLSLPYKGTPYTVVSDLTVMPGAKLVIEPGTVIEFHPNVGILVLGQIVARGLPFARITLRPIASNARVKRAVIDSYNTSVRLHRDNSGKIPENEGFLQLFNISSQSWNFMCDSHFNEKMAEVVCRSQGLETVNVDVRFTHLYDHYIFGEPMYFLKEFWRYSYYCHGDEAGLDSCMKRVNYDIQKCIQAANYTYIRCGRRNLDFGYQYWGNIRIAPPTYEEEIKPVIKLEDRSVLEYIDIHGAGMLHGEKVGAVQATYDTPIISNLNITGCLLNGLDMVAPRHEMKAHMLNISGNLGYAVNMLILNGESRDIDMSSFTPLHLNTVPYNIHGLVDICKMEKEISINNRLIVFYKYSQTALDCVKIVTSQNALRRVSLRFLQFNLYHDDFYRNTIEIFDGKTVSLATEMGELTYNSSRYDISRRYLSSGSSIAIHIHASPSFGEYGFIAEVVAFPLSGLTYPDSSYNHILQHIEMKGNEDGAILYKNVGEVNPSLYVDQCWIEGNGVAILNLTSPPVIDIGLQDTKIFIFEHNFVSQNLGGMYVDAITQSVATHIRGNISNNVFSFGRHGETLRITGHHYQRFRLHENYIFNNTAGDFVNTVYIDNVGMNATFNVIGNNTAHHIVKVFGQQNTEATQMFLGNMWFENNTTAKYRSIFKVGGGKPLVNNNYFVNLESDFEMEANHKQGVADDAIDATKNWWGSNRLGYINGKIWDSSDNDTLVSITADPYRVSNQSIIDGKCAPGWRIHENRCYRYMGAALPYHNAISFCRRVNGFLAEVKGRENFIRYLIRTTESVYKETQRVWIYAEVAGGYCSSFEDNFIVAEQECHRKFLPFVCEKDPYILPPGSEVLTMAIAISASVFGIAIIIIVVLLILWRVKSRQRKEEQFGRTQSIRMSKTSLNKSRSTIAMLDDKYSVSGVSSRSRYSDEKSMMASAMSLTSEKRGHRDSRYDSNGYIGSRDRLHENGRARSRDQMDSERRLGNRDDRLNSSNRRLGSRDRLNNNGRYGSQGGLQDDRKYGSRDGLNDQQRSKSRDKLDEKMRSGSRERLNRSEERLDRVLLERQTRSNLHQRDNKKNGTIQKNGTVPKERQTGSPQEKKRLVPAYLDNQDTDVGYTDDGFSENEFDDFTTTADEGGKDPNDTDAASTVINFHTTKKPPHVENEIDSLHVKPSMNDLYQNHTFNSTPSVDLSGAKSLSSFYQPESPGERPPTPPPPLPVDQYPSKSRNQSTDHEPVPQPRQRPTPVPRSLQNSRERMDPGSGSERSGPINPALRFQNAPGRPPLHLSRESLNYLDNRREWMTDQMPEKQEDSEEETETETESETESSEESYEEEEKFTDKKDLPHPVTYHTDPHNRPNSRENLYDPKTYIPPPYEPPPYEAPTYGNLPDDDYTHRSRSRENLPQSFSTMDGGQSHHPHDYNPAPPVNPGSINLGFNRSRENIPEAMSNMDYLKDVPYGGASNDRYRPGFDNGAFVASPKHSPTEPMGSVNDVRGSNQYLDQLSRSRENLQGYPGHGNQGNMGSRNDVSRSRQSLDHLSRSRENIHGSMLSVHSQHRSRDNLGVVYLDSDRSQSGSRPQPIETEI